MLSESCYPQTLAGGNIADKEVQRNAHCEKCVIVIYGGDYMKMIKSYKKFINPN